MSWTLFWQVFVLIGWVCLWIGVLSGVRANQKTDAVLPHRLKDRN